MLTHNRQKRPLLEMLSQPFLERIVSEAMEVLSKVGIFVRKQGRPRPSGRRRRSS